jgi:hypothetical protein
VSPASARLLADGDSAARQAFRVALRADGPAPTPLAAGVTQELDADDILEVSDMAEAIARAELRVGSPRVPDAAPSGPSLDDLFDTLGHRPRPQAAQEPPSSPRATDDTAGAASPAPPAGVPTPLPPLPPRYVTMPSALAAANEDDAFYHPAGRIRGLADVTLDGYRPEPTLLVRAASRRKNFSWLLVAALLPLLVLAAIGIFTRSEAAFPSAGAKVPEPATTVPERARLSTSSADAKASSPALHRGASKVAGAAPVVDVKSLPPASARR